MSWQVLPYSLLDWIKGNRSKTEVQYNKDAYDKGFGLFDVPLEMAVSEKQKIQIYAELGSSGTVDFSVNEKNITNAINFDLDFEKKYHTGFNLIFSYAGRKDDEEKAIKLWCYNYEEFASLIDYLGYESIPQEVIVDLYRKALNRAGENCNKLDIIYEPNVEIKESLSEQEDFIYRELKNSFKTDSRNRNTSVGPHRDDISFIVNDIDMRNFGSQGQQRTCALSLKLAELNLIKEKTDEDAILLLDDVMSELDADRQEFLIDTMKKNQLFITTTELDQNIKDKFDELKIFYIENGTLI